MSSFLYRGPQSPQTDVFAAFSSNPLSPQQNPNRLSGGMVGSTGEPRGGMIRRFTTNALPTLSPIGQQRLQAAGDNAMSLAYSRVTPSERKIRHIENLLEQQRRINAELDQVDDETRREIEEGLRHEREVTQFIAQSEPTTPPGEQDSFPPVAVRPNRYSTTSLTSQPSLVSRSNRASAQFTSPPVGFARPYSSHTVPGFPSQSVPGSRRHSDDEDEDDFLHDFDRTNHRAAANPNRNSMPVTSYDRKSSAADLSAALGPLNTTSFLFEDEEKAHRLSQPVGNPSSPDAKTTLQLQHTADGFPKLIRREDSSRQSLSGPPAALDLALSQGITADQGLNDRAPGKRHRVSLPPTALSTGITPLNGILAAPSDNTAPSNPRSSLEVKFTPEVKRPPLMAAGTRALPNGTAKAQPSYSTNDLPTLKSIDGAHNAAHTAISPSVTHSVSKSDASSTEQQSTSTYTPASSLGQTKDFPNNAVASNDVFQPAQPVLPLNATPFAAIPEMPAQHFAAPAVAFAGGAPYYNTAYSTAYGMQMLANSINSMQVNPMSHNGMHTGAIGHSGTLLNGAGTITPNFNGSNGIGMNVNGTANNGMGHNGVNFSVAAPWQNPLVAAQQGSFGGYQQREPQRQPVANGTRPTRSSISSNLAKDGDEVYNAVNVFQLRGQIYSLGKDQHGCRFLQRKLDERRDEDVNLIFEEVKDHFIELMTDPFGNYLCQRLLEHANDAQRTILIKNAGPSMTNIAINQHGTRALQRMIDFVSNSEQTRILIEAIGEDVVALIKDLNGNHVIQKCLNHLSSENAEFIFSAVGANCVTVGTHRHGCCVLQRCVDHAGGLQKGRLVNCIINNSLSLVQDAFGNYVVQYVLDLSEPCFTQPLCRALAGHVASLSRQKFSSNVIEKCVRCADADTRRMLIQELMVPAELEKMLRDSYANYVVQTALEHAPEDLKQIFVDRIRPILPSIRNTPHGRRIASKITDHDIPGNTNWIPGLKANGDANGLVPSMVPAGRGNRMGMIGAPWGHGIDPITAFSNGTNGIIPSAMSPPSHGHQDYADGPSFHPNGFSTTMYNNTHHGLGGMSFGRL